MRHFTHVTHLSCLAAFSLIAILGAGVPSLHAQESRLVEQGGLVYEEREITVREPVADVQLVPKQETIYEPKVVTELRDVAQTRWELVTTYQWQERWQYPLGILGPQKTGNWVPGTQWQPRVEYVRQPVTYRTQVAETRTTQTPVRSLRFVEKQQVQRRLLGPAAAFQQASVARGDYPTVSNSASQMPISSRPRFDDEKLRYGLKPTDASVWR